MKKSITTTKTIATVISLLLLIAPMFVFAQITNPLKYDKIDEFISDLLGYVVKVGGVVATFFFIWAGFLYVQARGNETELTKAKEVLMNTIYGTVLLLGAQLIGTIIKGTITDITTK